jgi:GATA-binding protein
MNIDDFIFPNSIASPAGLSASPPTPPSHTTASAIPIQTKKDIQDPSHPNFPPSAPPHDGLRNHEFDYVRRRVRKTSIDETKVRFIPNWKTLYLPDLLTSSNDRAGSGQPNSPLKYIRPTAS